MEEEIQKPWDQEKPANHEFFSETLQTAKFENKDENILDSQNQEFPQKISKEGVLENGPKQSKVDEIISKAKTLQGKLNNMNFEPNKNPLQAFQTKRDEVKREEWFIKNANVETFSLENKLLEYPIEKIGDIVAAKKNLSPELELQKLKLDEAGYMDSYENNKEQKNHSFESFQQKNVEKNYKKNEEMIKFKPKKNQIITVERLVCSHKSMLEKFRKAVLCLKISISEAPFAKLLYIF